MYTIRKNAAARFDSPWSIDLIVYGDCHKEDRHELRFMGWGATRKEAFQRLRTELRLTKSFLRNFSINMR